MDVESFLQIDLNKNIPKVNQLEHVFDRMQTYKGVFGVTFVTNYKLSKTSLPVDEADTMIAEWMPIVRHLERNLREKDPSDGLLALQVATTAYQIVIAFGYVDGDFEKMYAILVHQTIGESSVPEDNTLVRKGQDTINDPRDYVIMSNVLREFRKKMWNDNKDIGSFFNKGGKWELEHLEEIQKVPEGRGWKKQGNEVKIFHDFLSRCQVSRPDDKTGKSKWTYLEKPVLRDYDIPDLFTRHMAKEFANTKEEVDTAVENIEELIDKGAFAGEESQKRLLKRQLEKQRRKILLGKMEQLRKKRFDKNWQKKCVREDIDLP